MAYKKKTYKKKYVPKKKRTMKRKRTFKAKTKGKALMKMPNVAMQRLPGKQIMPVIVKNNTGIQIPDSNYAIGAVALINNPAGYGQNSPVQWGQTWSFYRCANLYSQWGQWSTRYDEFRVTGVRTKFMFPSGGTLGGNNLISLELFYDGNSIAWGVQVPQQHIEAFSNYQCIPITVNNTTITRYWDCKPILKKQGLGWCSTKDIPDYITGNGGFSYYGQLANDVVPSIGWRITTIGVNGQNSLLGSCEVTYYFQFRGLNYGYGGLGVNNPEEIKTCRFVVTDPIIVDAEAAGPS